MVGDKFYATRQEADMALEALMQAIAASIFTWIMAGYNKRAFRQYIVLHMDIKEIVRMTSVCKMIHQLIFSQGEYMFNLGHFDSHLKK